MNSYAAPGNRRSVAAEAILRREGAGGEKQQVVLGERAGRACPSEGKGAVLIEAIRSIKPTARRFVAEASGKRLLGNNNCYRAFAGSQPRSMSDRA